MSLSKTVFLGDRGDGKARLPFDKLLKKHEQLRDVVGRLFGGEHAISDDLWPFVALASFSYALNTYKAIGLLLPHLYHECGYVLLRQLWETSLNLHWIEQDPAARAQDFCNFTVMEVRKNMRKAGNTDQLAQFDTASSRFQSRFRVQQNARERIAPNFAGGSVEERARALGEPWIADYNHVYHLASMHAHAAPGAILQQHFVNLAVSPENKEKDSTALVAYLSMKVLVSDAHLMVRRGFASSSAEVDEIFKDSLTLD